MTDDVTTLGPTTIEVAWDDLLNAHQGFLADDPALHPYLRIDTGQVTCPLLLPDEAESLIEQGILLSIPVKGSKGSWDQRLRFAETLCDLTLEDELTAALNGPDPFRAFDTALAEVPIEAMRWEQEQRNGDMRALQVWLRRCGYQPEQPPTMTRKIVEFPLKRQQ